MAAETLNRRVWRLAGPIMVSNISVPLLGAVDTAVVGHLPGPQHLGAVAVGALVFNILLFGFGFLRMGTTGLTAQAFGAGHTDEVRASLARAVLVAAVLGIALLALNRPLAWAAVAAIEPSGTVEPLFDAYFSIRIWGAPAALVNHAMLGWFIGIHNTRAALVQQVAMNGTNIVLDLWFVLGLGFGVAGVAAATVISQLGAVALGIWLVRRNLRSIGGAWRRDLVFDGRRLRRLVEVNRDIFIRTACLIAGNALFVALGSRMGDVVLAANAVLLHFHHFASWALDGFALAAEAMVGSAVGAGDRRRFRDAVRATGLWALGFSVAFTAVYALVGPLVIDVITNQAEVRATALTFLPWAVAIPVAAVWGFMLDGIFIGATRTAEMRNAMIVSVAVYGAAVVALVPPWQNHGLWLAFYVLTAARAASLALLYPRIQRAVGEKVP